MSKMLRKYHFTIMVCTCNRHHKPTRSWKKRERHRARSREKQALRKEEN